MENIIRFERIEQLLSNTHSMVKDLQDKMTPASRPSTSGSTVFDKTLVKYARDAIKDMLKVLSKRQEPMILSYETYEDVIAKRDVVVSEIKMNKADRLWATEDILNEAFRQVWSNQRDDFNRELSGKKANHRASNRRNRRRIKKMNKRIAGVEKSRKPADWKARAKVALTRECTSPDVTDDESGGRYVMPFVWESQLLREVKEHLDQVGGAQGREDHPTQYSTAMPSRKVPAWAIRGNFNEITADMMTSASASSTSTSSPSSCLSTRSPSSPSSCLSTLSPSSPSSCLSTLSPSSPDISFSPSSVPQSTPCSRQEKQRPV